VNGTAVASGLNATAIPHNPAPTAAVMLTRSKIVIDVDPFTSAQTFRIADAAEPHAVPKPPVDDRVNY
jgi:hypothetical protein